MATSIDNPILNSPYEGPNRHYQVGPEGPTGEILDGRRPSESFIPIAISKKGKGDQGKLDLFRGERSEKNDLINAIRRDVEKWRMGGHYPGATPITRKLLQHWADPNRENRVLFCQREAAETIIFLTEVAGRHGTFTDWRKRLDEVNESRSSGLPRVALKMATGSGKTVVMAMLIAWQTINKQYSPRDARFTDRFLVVTPGITIRDRLRVLIPEEPENYYDLRDLVPGDLKGSLEKARIFITNYHAFQLKDAKEIRGIAKNTRLLLKGDRAVDAFKETPKAMVSRVLRKLGDQKQQILVFNDEAHHCYQDKPLPAGEKASVEEKNANEEARVWFKGLQAIAKYDGIKQIVDLSATPFYLAGSGYSEGHIFPWTVSDFSLMDAIESGIVKVPRTPVDDDADHKLVTYLRLWDFIGTSPAMPKRVDKEKQKDWIPPPELEGALKSLHRSYKKAFIHWENDLAPYGETPPVFIVVCPNTVVSKLVYNWIAGEEVEQGGDVIAHKNGNLELLANVVDSKPLARPRTILIDSVQLESGEGMKADFKEAAGAEIAAFKAEYHRRNPGADLGKITDEELLREAMNTVGKRGKLGEQVRCVVSVSMLTEGWDTNTVTHILGVRAFGSQLLCEQVVGRGLRRRNYMINDDGHFEPEYANVYGIPFQFIPSDRPAKDPQPPRPVQQVAAVEGREALRITFPNLTGYRIEVPDDQLFLDEDGPEFEVGPSTVPRWVDLEGVIGTMEREDGKLTPYREQEVAYAVAKRVLDQQFNTADDRRPWLFPRLIELCRWWIKNKVVVADGYSLGHLMAITESQVLAAEKVSDAIAMQVGNRRERLRPMINRFNPVGSTAEVDFVTRKAVVAVERSEVSHVTLDGKTGNTWEQLLAEILEHDPNVAAFVKNDHLHFHIPYVHKGRSHNYVPDFLVRLRRPPDETFDRTLIVEVSGSQKSPGPTQAKANTARNSWCVAVNNHEGFGRWGYVEMTDPLQFKPMLADAIQAVYGDLPIIGDPDLLDLDYRSANGA